MTPCPDREPLLQALLDGELDAANTAAIEAHLKTCAGCAARYRTLRALSERLGEADLATPAPDHLRARVVAALNAEEQRAAPRPRPRPQAWWTRAAVAWSTAGAMAAVAATLVVGQAAPADTLQDELVASHIRSLQAAHLIDVATSDRHVVRPWFNGRIDYAPPPVPDLAAAGFPLAGGRLDYAQGRTVAAVVYRRRAHVINLFVLPARDRPWRLALTSPKPPPGYAVVHWRHAGLDYWAVSDVEGGELEAFHRAFEAREAG